MKTIIALFLLLSLASTTLGKQKFVTYIDKITQWWPAQAIAEGLGVPGYSKNDQYNVINLAFLLAAKAADTALIWQKPLEYFGQTTCPFGKTKQQVQKTLRDLYNKGNTKIMISAFGATEFPTTEGKDPVKTCTDLANFVKSNDLDGIDLDWEDNAAMNNGTGEQWLIDCMKAIREVLPVGEYLLTNAPQGPYFLGKPVYKNGGYVKIHQEVGHLIDWYNIQFYNQGNESYDTYEKLFGDGSTTSVKSIMDKAGVPKQMIVVGKPVNQGDASNTGVVNPSDLGRWAARAKSEFGWETGIMTWQFSSDANGDYVKSYKSAHVQADFRQKFDE